MSLLFLRIQEFKVSLSEQKLDIKALRQLCFSGTCVCVCGESGCLSPHGYTLSLSLSQGSRVKEAFALSAGRSVWRFLEFHSLSCD